MRILVFSENYPKIFKKGGSGGGSSRGSDFFENCGHPGTASGIIRVAGYSSQELDSRPFLSRQRFIAEMFGDNKVNNFFAEFSEKIPDP